MTRLFQSSESKVRVSAKKGYTKEEKLEILENTSTKERYHDELNNNMLKKIVQVVCCGEKEFAYLLLVPRLWFSTSKSASRDLMAP